MPKLGLTNFPEDVAFTPTGSPVGWWSADEISGLEDGDPVGTWSDRSGQGNDLTQATAAKRPTYQTNEQNGLPVVRFDGTDDILGPASFTLTQPESIFMAFEQISYAHGNAFLDGTTNWYMFFGQRGSSPVIQFYDATFSEANSSLAMNSFGIVSIRFGTNSDTFIRVNGGNQTGGAGDGGYNGGGLTLGSDVAEAGNSNIDVGELVVYNGTEGYADNEAGLNTKWSVY